MLDAVLAGARPGSLGAQLRRQPMHPNNPPATPTQDALDRFLIPDASDLAADLAVAAPGRGARGAALDAAVCRLLDDWSLLSFVALDRGEGEEDEGGRGVADVLAQACAQGGRRGARVCRRGGGGGGVAPALQVLRVTGSACPGPNALPALTPLLPRWTTPSSGAKTRTCACARSRASTTRPTRWTCWTRRPDGRPPTPRPPLESCHRPPARLQPLPSRQAVATWPPARRPVEPLPHSPGGRPLTSTVSTTGSPPAGV